MRNEVKLIILITAVLIGGFFSFQIPQQIAVDIAKERPLRKTMFSNQITIVDGEMVLRDNTIRLAGQKYAKYNKIGYTHISVNKEINRFNINSGVNEIEYEGNYVKETPQFDNIVRGKLIDGIVVFENAWNNADFKIETIPDGKKETIILKNKNCQTHFEFTLETNMSRIELLKVIVNPIAYDTDNNEVEIVSNLSLSNPFTYTFDVVLTGTETFPVIVDPTLEFGTVGVFDAGDADQKSIVKVNDSTLIVVYLDDDDGNVGNAVVAKYSGNVLDICGTEYQFTIGQVGSTDELYVERMTDTTVIVGYTNSADDNGWMIVGIVRDTLIHFAFEGDYEFSAADVSDIEIAKSAEDTFLLAFKSGATLVGVMAGAIANDTTISCGGLNNTGQSNAINNIIDLDYYAANAALVSYDDLFLVSYGDSMRMGSRNGVTITWYTAEKITVAGSWSATAMDALTQNLITAVYVNTPDITNYVIDVVGSTFVEKSLNTITGTSEDNRIDVVALTANNYMVLWQDNVASDGQMKKVNFSGSPTNLYTNGVAVQFESGAIQDIDMTRISDDMFATAYSDMGDGSAGKIVIGQVFDLYRPYDCTITALTDSSFKVTAKDTSGIRAEFRTYTYGGTFLDSLLSGGDGNTETIYTDTVWLPFNVNVGCTLRVLTRDSIDFDMYMEDSLYAFTKAILPVLAVADTTDTTSNVYHTDQNPQTVEYSIYETTQSVYYDVNGDVSVVISYIDSSTLRDTLLLTGLPPNDSLVFIISAWNDDVVETVAAGSLFVWTWAQIVNVNTTIADAVDSVTIKIGLLPQRNPSYTFYALEDSITGYVYNLNSLAFGSGVISADSTWQWYTYAEWGSAAGTNITVAENTRYVLRFYSKEGMIRE